MNEEEMKSKGTGADHSEIDPRTVKHENLAQAGEPLIQGGIPYLPQDIEDQHHVGICTAISLIQNRQKANNKKYSPDFQYLLQKKFYDFNWQEGSSIFNALKVAKNIGFLPLELWTATTEEDRKLPYDQYIAKLQFISKDEITRLMGLCVDKIPGYASINVNDPQAIAKAINESEAGILCRYGCQKNWWTSISGVISWLSKDINPLRNGPETSGHAIIMNIFDYSSSVMQKLANTWGTLWNLLGCADIDWVHYPMTEAWSILRQQPVIDQFPILRVKDKAVALIKILQTKLNTKISAGLVVDGDFGLKTLRAVKNFQTGNGLVADGVVGKLTWAKLNS